MKRAARVVLALLVAAGSVVVGLDAPASAGPEMPGFVCPPKTKPEICAAMQVVEEALDQLGVTLPDWVSANLASAGALGAGGVVDLTEYTYEQAQVQNCNTPQWQQNPHPLLGVGGFGSWWACVETVEAIWGPASSAIRQAEAAVAVQVPCFPGVGCPFLDEIAETVCGVFAWLDWCGLLADGNEAFAAHPGGSIYSGKADTDAWFPSLYSSVGTTRVLVVKVPTGEAEEVVLCWADMASCGSGVTGVQVLVKRTGTTATIRVRSRWGVNERVSPFTAAQAVGEGYIAVGVRFKTAFNASSPGVTLELVTPNGTGGANVVEWGPVVTTLLNRWGTKQESWLPRPAFTQGVPFAQSYANVPLSTLVEKIGLFDPGAPVPTGEPELPEPAFPDPDEIPDAPPAVPVPWPEAPTAPSVTEAPTMTTVPPVTEAGGEEGWFDRLGNRIGGFFDNLGSLIGSAFDWLGDLMRALLDTLLAFLRDMLEWLGSLIEALGSLLAGLLQWLGSLLQLIYAAIQVMTTALGGLLGQILAAIAGGLTAVVQAVWAVVQAVGSIAGQMVEALIDWFQWLLTPPDVSIPDLPSCEDVFPCSWVAAASDAAGAVGDGLDGLGGCTPPAIGWSEFSASLPAPSGCTSGNPGVDPSAEAAGGDLFGWRVPLRWLAALVMWLGVFRALIALAPWSNDGDFPLGVEGSR